MAKESLYNIENHDAKVILVRGNSLTYPFILVLLACSLLVLSKKQASGFIVLVESVITSILIQEFYTLVLQTGASEIGS